MELENKGSDVNNMIVNTNPYKVNTVKVDPVPVLTCKITVFASDSELAVTDD